MMGIDKKQFNFDSQLLLHIEKKENDEAQNILKCSNTHINLKDNLGNTLLHYSAHYSNDEMTKYLIDLNAEIDIKNEQGETPLFLAIESPDSYNWKDCNLKTIVHLLDAKANMHIRDNTGISPLSNALSRKFGKLQLLFLQKLKDECLEDSEKIAKKLIAANCSVFAALHLKNAEVTMILLDNGSVVEPPYSIGYAENMFQAAIQMNHLENIKALLDYGADPNAEGQYQATPLITYSQLNPKNQNPEILKLLLDRGAKPNMIMTGNHALQGKMQMCGVLQHCNSKSVRVLLESNVDLHARDSNGNTAIHYVIENMNKKVFEEFEGKKFDVNTQNYQGLTPLLLCYTVHLNALKFLIQNGADPNEKRSGRTILMDLYGRLHWYDQAMQIHDNLENDKQLVEYLLQHGADPQIDTSNQSFTSNTSNHLTPARESVIAHLAMLEIQGKIIDQPTRKHIFENDKLKTIFEKCKRLLKKFKKVTVWKSVTLYKLLIANEGKIESYMCHRGFRLKLSNMSIKAYSVMPYYCYALREKISRSNSTRLRNEAVIVMSNLTGINFECYHLIVDQIFSYLSKKDLLNFIRSVQMHKILEDIG